ncbi:MAG: MraY family glycosyltransferase [Syntrophobacteraceae bacterium]
MEAGAAPLGATWLAAATICVFAASFAFVAAVRSLSRRFGWMSVPREDRWRQSPVALHGGIGIAAAFFPGAVLTLLGSGALRAGSSEAIPTIALLAGALLMLLVGFVDDIKDLRPGVKLLWQTIAAGIFIGAGGASPISGGDAADAAIAGLWIVGLTNAVNMLDNMDGLAAGVLTIALGVLAALTAPVAGVSGGTPPAFPLSLLLAAALAGFWAHNRRPASVFMGDSGSLCVGYTLAALYLPGLLNGVLGMRGQPHGALAAFAVAAITNAVPICDASFVTVARLLRGASPFRGGADHSSHRLVKRGMSEQRAVGTMHTLAAFAGAAALLFSAALKKISAP